MSETHNESKTPKAPRVPKIAVEPEAWRRETLAEAVRAGGGEVVPPAEAEGLVWADPQSPGELGRFLAAGPDIGWVQLPYAGIEPYLPVLDHDRVWTCGKGVYAEPVAEHAMMLLLAGFRGMDSYGPARSWLAPRGKNLLGARLCILGGGGITQELLKLLAPWDVDVTVVRKHARELAGVPGSAGVQVRQTGELAECLATADAVVLALALTEETRGIIGADALEAMRDDAWLVNVARGEHVVTDDLVAALRSGEIAGAALDVTDPEPLPDGHPLWELPNCLITPHVGNTPEMGLVLLAKRVTENVARFARGEELLGPVYVDLKY